MQRGLQRLRTFRAIRIRRFASWNFVDTKPVIGGVQQARAVFLHIGEIVHQICLGIAHVNGENFPVRLALVLQRKRAQYFDL